jgi:hypothetical protein
VSRLEEARQEAERKLEESRRQATERLVEVKQAIEDEIGWVPKKAPWILALAAGAGGFALGVKALNRRRRHRSK